MKYDDIPNDSIVLVYKKDDKVYSRGVKIDSNWEKAVESAYKMLKRTLRYYAEQDNIPNTDKR